MKTKALLSGIAALAAFGAMSGAQAHEGRQLGKSYYIWVGSWDEPAYAGFKNGIDLYPEYMTATGKHVPIDTNAGDTFEVTTTDVYFWPEDSADNNAGNATYHAPMHAPEWKWGSVGNYVNNFFPTVAGAYGFHIVGTIGKKGKRPYNFDEYFICGEGSQSTEHAFGCYEVIQRFPAAVAATKGK